MATHTHGMREQNKTNVSSVETYDVLFLLVVSCEDPIKHFNHSQGLVKLGQAGLRAPKTQFF